MIVGEPYFSNGIINQGRVRVFFGNATGIIDSVAESTVASGVAGRALGTAVATGDLKADTHGDYAAGMPGYSNSQTGEGRVIVRSGEW